MYEDVGMMRPKLYDDVGDTAAWTGTLLAGIVHKYIIQQDSSVLTSIMSILRAFDFFTHNCTGVHGFIPRAWALPNATSPSWIAFRNYYTPDPPYLNGSSGVHGVYNCSVKDNENWLYVLS